MPAEEVHGQLSEYVTFGNGYINWVKPVKVLVRQVQGLSY